MKKNLILFFFAILIASCSSNQFSIHYNDEGLEPSDFIPLQMGQNVKIIETLNAERKLQEYIKNGYVVLGSSRFNSEWEPFSKAISVAKEKGATLVIMETENTGRDTKHYTMAIPQTNNVYHHGSVNAYSGGYSAYGNYSGTSTYTTINYVSGSYNISLFRQNAFFLAKSSDIKEGN
jgi:hypothetical protein